MHNIWKLKRFFCLSFCLLVCLCVLENLIFFSVCLLKELSQFKNHVNILLQFMNHKKCWVLKLRYIYIRTIFDQIWGSNVFLFHRHIYVIVYLTKENVQICQYVFLSVQHLVVIVWCSFHFWLKYKLPIMHCKFL